MKKNKADLVRGWLEKAGRDLKVAQRELSTSEPLTDIMCFHAQQAAEKYLKAYLLWNGFDFPKTHALEQLVLLASQQDSEFFNLKDEVVALTPYAVETRYPEFEEPLVEDAKEAVRIAEKVKDMVLRKLPKEVEGKGPGLPG